MNKPNNLSIPGLKWAGYCEACITGDVTIGKHKVHVYVRDKGRTIASARSCTIDAAVLPDRNIRMRTTVKFPKGVTYFTPQAITIIEDSIKQIIDKLVDNSTIGPIL